jgi:hypothetical protein
LRIDSYQLMSKGITEDTDKYLPAIEKVDKEIEELVKSLQE